MQPQNRVLRARNARFCLFSVGGCGCPRRAEGVAGTFEGCRGAFCGIVLRQRRLRSFRGRGGKRPCAQRAVGEGDRPRTAQAHALPHISPRSSTDGRDAIHRGRAAGPPVLLLGSEHGDGRLPLALLVLVLVCFGEVSVRPPLLIHPRQRCLARHVLHLERNQGRDRERTLSLRSRAARRGAWGETYVPEVARNAATTTFKLAWQFTTLQGY